MVLQAPPPLHDPADASMNRHPPAVAVRPGSDIIRVASRARRSDGVCRGMHQVHNETR